MGGRVMSVDDLLVAVRRAGVEELRVHGETVRYRPACRMPEALREQLRQHKREVIEALQGHTGRRVAAMQQHPSMRRRQTSLVDRHWYDIPWDDLPHPDPCPVCGGSLFWWDFLGKAHCETCRPEPLRRSFRLAALAERLRRN